MPNWDYYSVSHMNHTLLSSFSPLKLTFTNSLSPIWYGFDKILPNTIEQIISNIKILVWTDVEGCGVLVSIIGPLGVVPFELNYHTTFFS